MKPITLELAPVQPGEPPMKQLAVWDDFRAKAAKLKATAETLTVTDSKDRAGMALARTTRLTLKDVRVAITKRHKELKEDILTEGRRIDAGKNELLAMIEPLETRLLEQEQFAEREAARIQAEKHKVRLAELHPFMPPNSLVTVDLGTMDDDAYFNLLLDTKATHDARIERERKEREEAQARAKAEAEERDRMRVENERLKAEAAEREATARQEREAAALVLAKERAEAEKLRAAVDRAARESERIEREKAEAEAAAKKARAMTPVKDKLNKLAADIRALAVPFLSEPPVEKNVREIMDGIERFAKWIESKANFS